MLLNFFTPPSNCNSRNKSLPRAMDSPSTVFMFFYGLFWAGVMNSLSRYQLFFTHQLFSGNQSVRSRSARRLVVGVFVANLFPIAYGVALYHHVIKPLGEGGFWVHLFAALAALS